MPPFVHFLFSIVMGANREQIKSILLNQGALKAVKDSLAALEIQ